MRQKNERTRNDLFLVIKNFDNETKIRRIIVGNTNLNKQNDDKNEEIVVVQIESRSWK